MAKEIGDLIVRLSLDSSKFEDGLKRFEEQMIKVRGQFRSAATGLTDFDKVTAKLKTSAETLTERLSLQREKVAQLEKAYDASKTAKGADADETQRLGQRLEEAKTRLSQTEQALKLVNEQVKLNQNGWYQLGVNLEGVGTKLQTVGKDIASAGQKLSLIVTAPIVALGAKSLQAGIEFESAFAGVRKTVNASEEDFQKLSQSVKDMSEVIPATTSELSGIMELAGQLGVDTGNLEKFTKTIAALGVSTNLTNDEAAAMLAQFANITSMKLENIDRLSSTIVALGNNFATTEASIVQMGQRLAGAGSQVGMTEPQIMAFATALSSVGIEAEAGGSAFSKLMVNMKVASETGMKAKDVIAATGLSLRELELLSDQDSKAFKKLASGLGLTTTELKTMMSASGDLDKFAKVAGMTAEQFATAYGENAAGALTQFLVGLRAIEDNGGSAVVTLDEMGITEVRLRDAILRASSATDLFAAAQELANTAWDDNVALQNEASQRYATTESRLQMLKNSANNLAISFSEVMLPALEKLMEKLRGVIDWLKGLSDEEKETIVKVAAFAATIGPVLLVVGKLTSGIGTFMKVIAPLAKAIGGAQAATGALGTAMSAIAGPVLVVIGVVAGLVAIFQTLYTTNEEFRAKMDALWAQITAAFENVREVFAQTFERIKAAMEPVKDSLTKLWETVQEVFTRLWEFLEPVITAVAALVGTLLAAIVSAANGILNAVGPMVDAVVNGLVLIMNVFSALIALLQGDFAGAWDSLKAAFASLWIVVQDVFTAIGNFFTGFWESLCAIASSFGIDLNGIFSGLWGGIQSGASTAWSTFSLWASETWNTICNTAQTVWGTLTTFFSGLWEDISTTASRTWNSICATISSLWTGMTTTATSVWNTVCTNVTNAVNTGKTWISTAWENVKTAVTGIWDTVKTTATTAWDTVCTNVKSAVDGGKIGIQSAWSTISTGISTAWDTFKNTASTSWGTITGGVKKAIEDAKSGIVTAWDAIKTGVKDTWDGITAIFKDPIDSASNWLSEKVEWFKGLFNFEWKLPEFKLPKIEVTWNEIGWGISIPSLSLKWNALGAIFQKPTIFNTAAGLQGVGEAGPEAVLPLNTLWDEMSQRLKQGMREIQRDAAFSQSAREDAMMKTILSALREERSNSGKPTSVQVTQNIYAKQTSYVAQQREAARNFRQIARALA